MKHAILFLALVLFTPILAALPLRVGIEDDREEVTLRFTGATVVTQRHKSWKFKRGQEVSFRVRDIRPGLVHYHVGLEVIDFRARATLKDRIEFYEQMGIRVDPPRLLGGLLEIKGQVVNDNRRYFLLSGFTTDELATKKRQDELAAKGLTGFIFREVMKSGDSTLEIKQKLWRPLKEKAKIRIESEKPILVEKVAFGRGYSWGGQENRKFTGPLVIYLDPYGKLGLFTEVGLEEYLMGVLPSEMSPSAPFETLKAQAVCARGDTLSKLRLNHIGEPFEICSEVHCQVFSGLSKRKATSDRAVRATAGQVLSTPDGEIAEALYSACCGGATEHNDNVWKSPPRAHLRGHYDYVAAGGPDLTSEENVREFITHPPDVFCGRMPYVNQNHFRWEKKLTGAEITELLKARKDLGAIRFLEIHARGVSGRVLKLTVRGETDSLILQRELPIRQAFGNLRSALFFLEQTQDEKGFLRTALFKGAGWGHGVGMCQKGAMNMGDARISYDRILAHYYRGATLRQLDL